MTTIDDLKTRAPADVFTLADPLDALAWFYRRACYAHPGAADEAASTILATLDTPTTEPVAAPPVRFDGEGDVLLNDPTNELDAAVMGGAAGLGRSGSYVMGGAHPDDLDALAAFLHAAATLIRQRSSLADTHAAAIDALRAAGWTVHP